MVINPSCVGPIFSVILSAFLISPPGFVTGLGLPLPAVLMSVFFVVVLLAKVLDPNFSEDICLFALSFPVLSINFVVVVAEDGLLFGTVELVAGLEAGLFVGAVSLGFRADVVDLGAAGFDPVEVNGLDGGCNGFVVADGGRVIGGGLVVVVEVNFFVAVRSGFLFAEDFETSPLVNGFFSETFTGGTFGAGLGAQTVFVVVTSFVGDALPESGLFALVGLRPTVGVDGLLIGVLVLLNGVADFDPPVVVLTGDVDNLDVPEAGFDVVVFVTIVDGFVEGLAVTFIGLLAAVGFNNGLVAAVGACFLVSEGEGFAVIDLAADLDIGDVAFAVVLADASPSFFT